MIQSKTLAEALAKEGESFIKGLNQALLESKTICSPEEYEKFKRAVGIVVGNLEIELMWPLYKLHPELEPESLKGWENGP
jgi:hypothetical protein